MARSKLTLTVVIAALVLVFARVPVTAGPTLVFDAATGAVLHSDDAGKPWYPASLTKLMTGYVVFRAIKAGKITLKSKIPYSAKARAEPASKIGLPVGTTFTVDWALQALLVRSANDIAVALAEGIGGSEANFVRMMNDHAKRLAMTGTYFSNPHGLPDRRNVTTARDMGLLARAIIREFPEYQRFFDAPHVRHGKRRLKNRNTSFLKLSKYSDGMKTGFICNSGFNVVASQTIEGRRLVAVVLGSKNSGVRAQLAHKLIQEGFTAKPGGLLNRPRKLIELTNGGIFARYPTDMAKKVCRRMGSVRITQAKTVRGWSVILAREENARDAQKFLDRNLKPLRDVTYAGRAAVVREPGKGAYAAMIYSLDEAQTRATCSHLRSENRSCEVLPPDTYKEQIAALKAEAKTKPKKASKPKKTKPTRKATTKPRKRKKPVTATTTTRSTQKRTTTTSTPNPAPQGSFSLR